MKKLKLLTVTAIVALLTCSFVCGCNKNNNQNNNTDSGYQICSYTSPYLEVAPDVDDDMELGDIPTDEAALKSMAVNIYEIANENDQLVEGRLYYSTCTSSNVSAGMDNKIDLIIFSLKDGEEYFRIDYRVKNNVPLFNIVGKSMERNLNESLNLVLAERIYYNNAVGGDCIKQTVKNADRDENIMPYADWSNPQEDVVDVPAYLESQMDDDNYYKRCAHDISEETIKSVTITHNDELGYYTVSLNVDTDKACTVTNEDIRAGSGDSNAKYVELLVEYEVWDSGYYKSYHEYSRWTGKAIGVFAIESSFDYHDVYSYNVADYDIDTFADAKAAKAAYTK